MDSIVFKSGSVGGYFFYRKNSYAAMNCLIGRINMNIRFFTGSSGCGKSKILYDTLIDISQSEPDRKIFLVVPEQFTMQAQRNIVENSPGHGTFNIDIVSFNRLAYRVFEELGIELPTAIDDTGKNLILRKIIDENRKDFKIIRAKDSQGFVSEIKSVISELLQYSVTPDMLRAACEKLNSGGINNNERLRRKLWDITLIYEAFREYISDKYITTEEVTGILCRYVDRSELLKDAVFAFDGFTGFTPVQYQLIELLFEKAQSMYFTATLPKDGDRWLFDMSYDMLRRVGECADKHYVKLKRENIGGEIPYRFIRSPQLVHLEKNLFRDTAQYDGQADNIVIYSALGKKAEVEYVASRIKKLAKEGVRYRQIGVIAGSMEDYREIISTVFEENGIPVFMDNKRSILANPAVEYIRAVLAIIEKDYSYEAVFRLLKGYMCRFDKDKIDLFENYVLALGIRGHKRYSEPFRRRFPSKRELDMDIVNDMRVRLYELMEPLYNVFHDKESSVADYIDALNAFLDESRVFEQLENLTKQMETEHKAAAAKEYSQSYEKLMELFSQTRKLLGDEKLGIREFSDILDAGFNEIKIGIIPPTFDMVMVGDIERTRLDHVSALFFVGVNEGMVPQINTNHGLFSEAERELLEGVQLELSPTSRQKAFRQSFYLYLLLTKPSDRLIFTVNREGKPSKLISDIRRMFPCGRYESDDSMEPTELIYNSIEGFRYIFSRFNETSTLSDIEKAMLVVLKSDTEYAKKYNELASIALRSVDEQRITENAARLLYGERLMGSVSRMETFAACAFAHFAKYGLELEERKLYEIGAADLGTLFHEALKIYSMRLADEKLDFASVGDRRKEYIREAVEYAMTDYNNSVFYDSKRNEYMREKIYSMLERTAWALGKQTQAGSFVPEKFEKSFIFEQNGMKIVGKIDRIDIARADDRSYVKIIDYKSGKRTLDLGRIYDGLSLQLMVYLYSLMKDNEPGAAMYYNIDNPIVDYKEGVSAEDGILSSLQPQGIVNSDSTVLKLLDNVTTSGKSCYIPVSYNKDGSLSKTSQAASGDRLKLLGEYASMKLVELGERISEGEVAPNPYPDSCDYCPYRLVCGFDAARDGYRYPTKLNNDDSCYIKFSEGMNKDGKKLD